MASEHEIDSNSIIREKYISGFYYINPSVYKYTQLLILTKNEIINLLKFLNKALCIRNVIIVEER